MAQPKSLLDLPGACLTDVVKKLDSTSRLALFATCTTLKDLVLSSADRTSLVLQPLDLSQEQMMRGLELIHQHARTVAIRIDKRQQQVSQANALTELSCSILCQAHRLAYLARVTSLELVGLRLPVPLMPVVSDSCPSLPALTSRNSNITWAGVQADSSFNAVFPKLRSLQLHVVSGQALSEACGLGLQQQIAQLTGLKSLHLAYGFGIWGSCRPLYRLIAAALTPSHVSQMLELLMPDDCLPAHQWQFNQFRNLRTLQLSIDIKDQLMQQLLILPNLTTVSVCTVDINQSYIGHGCRWQELTVQYISLQSFARLPLHSNLQIKSEPNSTVSLSHSEGTSADIQDALDNISTNKWAGWKGVHVVLHHWPVDLLVQALPLCHGVGRLVITDKPFTVSDALGLGDFVAVQQQGFVLDLWLLNCTAWVAAGLAGVVSRLPAGSGLVVLATDEATVVELCSAAQHSFALHVKLMQNLQAGAKKRVEEALLLGGCKGVVVHETEFIEDCVGACMEWVVILEHCHSADADSLPARIKSLSWAASLQGLTY